MKMNRVTSVSKTDKCVATGADIEFGKGKKKMNDLLDDFTSSQISQSRRHNIKEGHATGVSSFNIKDHETAASSSDILKQIRKSNKNFDDVVQICLEKKRMGLGFPDITDKPQKKEKRKKKDSVDQGPARKRKKNTVSGVADSSFSQYVEFRLKSHENDNSHRKSDKHISNETECSPPIDVTTFDSQLLPSGHSDVPGHEEEDFTIQTQTTVKSDDSFGDITEAADLIPHIQRNLRNATQLSKHQVLYLKEYKSIDLCADKLLENIDRREKEKENDRHHNLGCSKMPSYLAGMNLEPQPEVLFNSHYCSGNKVLGNNENSKTKKKKKMKERCCTTDHIGNIPTNSQLVHDTLSNVPDYLKDKHKEGEGNNSHRRKDKKQKSKFQDGLIEKNVNSGETEMLNSKKTKDKKQKILESLDEIVLENRIPGEITDTGHIAKKKKRKKAKVRDPRDAVGFEPQGDTPSPKKELSNGEGFDASKERKRKKTKNLTLPLGEEDLCQSGVNLESLVENVICTFDPVVQSHAKSEGCASVHKLNDKKKKKKFEVVGEFDNQDSYCEVSNPNTSIQHFSEDTRVNEEDAGFKRKRETKKTNLEAHKESLNQDFCETVNGANHELVDSEEVASVKRKKHKNKTLEKADAVDLEQPSPVDSLEIGGGKQTSTSRSQKKKKKLGNHEQSLKDDLCQSGRIFESLPEGLLEHVEQKYSGNESGAAFKSKKEKKQSKNRCDSHSQPLLFSYPTETHVNNKNTNSEKRKKKKRKKHEKCEESIKENMCQTVANDFVDADQECVDVIETVQTKKHKKKKKSKFDGERCNQDKCPFGTDVLPGPIGSLITETISGGDPGMANIEKKKMTNLEVLEGPVTEPLCQNGMKFDSLSDHANQALPKSGEIGAGKRKKEKKSKRSKFVEQIDTECMLLGKAMPDLLDSKKSELTSMETETYKRKKNRKKKILEESVIENVHHSNTIPESLPKDVMNSLIDCQNKEMAQTEEQDYVSRKKKKKKKRNLFGEGIEEVPCHSDADLNQLPTDNLTLYNCRRFVETGSDIFKRKKQKKVKKSIVAQERFDENVSDEVTHLKSSCDRVSASLDCAQNLCAGIENEVSDIFTSKQEKKDKRSDLRNECIEVEDTDYLETKKGKKKKKEKLVEKEVVEDISLSVNSVLDLCDRSNKNPLQCDRTDFVKRKKDKKKSKLVDEGINVDMSHPLEKSMLKDFQDINRSKFCSPQYSVESSNSHIITKQQTFEDVTEENEGKTSPLLDKPVIKIESEKKMQQQQGEEIIFSPLSPQQNEARTSNLLHEAVSKNDCENQGTVSPVSPVMCELEIFFNKLKDDPDKIVLLKRESQNEDDIEVELSSLDEDLLNHETSQIDFRSLNVASKVETTSNLDEASPAELTPSDSISVGVQNNSFVQNVSNLENSDEMEKERGTPSEAILCQKSNVNHGLKEIEPSQWHRLTCDSNGSFTQTIEHENAVFLPGMKAHTDDVECKQPEESSQQRSQDSGSVSSENEVLVPGRGRLRGLTQVFPAPGDKNKISGSRLESENNDRERNFNNEFVNKLAEKLALKLSTPPLSNNSSPENFGSSDDDEIQLTGRGNLRGLTQKFPSNALNAETKIHKKENDPGIDRIVTPSLEAGRSVMDTSMPASKSGESSSSSLDERDKADFVPKEKKVLKKRVDKKHRCTRCYTSFLTATEMMRHDCRLVRKKIQQSKRQTVASRYQCDVCDRKYVQKAHLSHHVKSIHLGLRPYECDTCNMRFATKQTLIVHIRIHTGSKPYKCMRCGESWRTVSHLHRHYRKYHFMVATEHCEFCDLSYFHEDDLEYHMKSKHKKKVFRTVTNLVDTSD